MLAPTSRSSTAPPGPTRAKICVASAEPNWTEAIPPMTSTGDGVRASRLRWRVGGPAMLMARS